MLRDRDSITFYWGDVPIVILALGTRDNCVMPDGVDIALD